jgi:hypothetical protein
MTIRIAFGAFVLATAFAVAAEAEPYWKGAAWYVVADTIEGPFVWKGPYASKEACETELPANEDDADYDCEYLSERPSWDD